MTAEDLKEFALFADLDDGEREAVAELFEERRLPDGKSAFREGSEAEGLVLLREGTLELRMRRLKEPLAVLQAPAALGAVSLFAFGKREVTARAQGSCTISVLPRSAMPRVVADAPRAAFRVAEAVVGELAALIRPSLPALVERRLE